MSQLDNLTHTSRPRKLREFAGNEATIDMVRGIVERGVDKMPHAWLLEGPTGCGKTSMARWISMRVNCKSPDGIDPCGECESCLGMLQDPPDHPSHLEVNASNHRKLDNMRSLIRKSKYAPMRGHKRVFLLDEPQGIIKEGQEALLIPIENPPPNTIWIFCTTDPGKLKKAIVGRCSAGHLTFRRVEAETLAKRLYAICKRERVKVPKKVLIRIAEISDGHPRNAIGMLDKVMALVTSKGSLSSDDIENMMLGIMDSNEAANPYQASMKYTEAIIRGNLEGAYAAAYAVDVPASIFLGFVVRHWSHWVVSLHAPDLVPKSHAWWTKKVKNVRCNTTHVGHTGMLLDATLQRAKDFTGDSTLELVSFASYAVNRLHGE